MRRRLRVQETGREIFSGPRQRPQEIEICENLAQEAANFLGFHSPTKEGPGSEADQWAPNLVNMFTSGLLAGVNQVAMAASKIAMPLTSIQNVAYAGGGGNSSGGGLVVQNYFQGMTIAQSQQELGNIVAQQIYTKIKGQGKF